MDLVAFKSIYEQVGTPFLQYILNYNKPLIYRASWEELNFNEKQLYVLDDLQQLLSECGKFAAAYPLHGITYFLMREGVEKDSRFNKYRRHCDGRIDTPSSSNSVENYLFQYTVNIYPALLIFPLIDSPFSDSRSALEVMADSESFIELLRNDNGLSQLLVEDNLSTRLAYLLANGVFTTSFDFSVLFNIIYRCFLNCCYRMNYSLEQVNNELRHTLAIMKKIVNGEEFEFSCFRGLYGLRLWGMNYFQFDENIILRAINSLHNPALVVRSTACNWNSNELGGVILEFKQKTRALPVPVDNYPATFTDHEMIKIVKHLKLAIVFASDIVHAPFQETFYDMNLPVMRGADHLLSMKTGGVGIVSLDNQQEIASWLELLQKNELSYLKVPLKRLQYAIFERVDPEDSLLDAFIAWEGMFSSKSETVFQVTAAIAKFLEDDLKKRDVFLNRLKELYSLRSNLTHGNSEEYKLVKRDGINKLRNEVLSIGLNCLKKLLESPDLLKMKPQDRIKHLLIFS